MSIFVFCILKIFRDGLEKDEILAWKTCKSQRILSLRYSSHPEFEKKNEFWKNKNHFVPVY